jgi:hypothetical protein
MVLASFNTFGNITKNTTKLPSAPVITAGTNGPTNTALIYFTPGSGTATNYKYSTNGVSYTALSPSQTTSPLTISGLSNGTTYNITIQSISNLGTSYSSNSVSVSPFYPFQSTTTELLPTLDTATIWQGICCDATGRYVMVATPGGYVRFSQDYGATFVSMGGANAISDAYRLNCDRSGKYAITSGYNATSYTCINCLSGATAAWFPTGISYTKDACVATNDTNGIMYVVAQGGFIWKTTFSKTATPGSLTFSKIGDTTNAANYYGICCSSDGKYVGVILVNGGIKYSQDYGATFSDATVSNGGFISIKCSITGKYMVAGLGANSVIWSSQNYGVTWNQDSNGTINNISYIYMDDSGYNAAFISGLNNVGDAVYFSTTANVSGGLVTVSGSPVNSIGSFGAGICGSSNGKFVYYTNGQAGKDSRGVYRVTSA